MQHSRSHSCKGLFLTDRAMQTRGPRDAERCPRIKGQMLSFLLHVSSFSHILLGHGLTWGTFWASDARNTGAQFSQVKPNGPIGVSLPHQDADIANRDRAALR